MSRTEDRSAGGMSRRQFLVRAGLAGAALTVAGGVAFRGAGETATPVRRYLTGFNDNFLSFADAGQLPVALDAVKFANGGAIRQNVDWRVVQPAPDGPYDWSRYIGLYGNLLAQDVEILPVIHGCPEWASPQGPPEADAAWRTCNPAHDEAFGAFAAETVRFFDSWPRLDGDPARIQAIEVGNEPNTHKFGGVEPSRLRQLSNVAADHVDATFAAGGYSFPADGPNPFRVISGGLATVSAVVGAGVFPLYPFRPAWQDYLAEMLSGDDEIRFDIGIHPYQTAKPPPAITGGWAPEGSSPFADGTKAVQYATWQAGEIEARYDEAEAIVSAATPDADLWVTETGASSASTWERDVFDDPGYRLAWGQTVQAGVLGAVARHLAASSRCRGMFVHRLYSDDASWSEGPGELHHRYGIYDPPLVPGGPPVEKLARVTLAEEWG